MEEIDYKKITDEFENKIIKAKKIAFPFCLIALIWTLILFIEIFFINMDFEFKIFYIIIILCYFICSFANFYYGYHEINNAKRQENLKKLAIANAASGNFDSALYTATNMKYNYVPKFGSIGIYGYYALLIFPGLFFPMIFHKMNFYNWQLIVYFIYIYIIEFYPIVKCTALIYTRDHYSNDILDDKLAVKKYLKKTITLFFVFLIIHLFLTLPFYK